MNAQSNSQTVDACMPVTSDNVETLEMLETLENLTFDNRFTRELPADPETENSRRQVMQACYSRVQPTPVAQPRLVAYAGKSPRNSI